MRKTLVAVAGTLLFLVSATCSATSTRTYVASTGNDANTAFTCDATHPCRTFAVALTQTTAGGEIVALDASGYGRVVIDRSVAIIGNPGVFAGIGVGAGGNGTGVEIATAGVEVVLRNLVITGQGGEYGIRMTAGSSLAVEKCVISNFSGHGIRVQAAAGVRVVETLFRDNFRAVSIEDGAQAVVSRSEVHGVTRSGVTAYVLAGGPVGVVSSVVVSDSVISGTRNGIDFGVAGLSQVAGSTVEIQVKNSSLSHLGYGVAAEPRSTMTVSGSLVTRNGTGLNQTGTGVLRSPGNNTVTENTTNSSGTVTPLTLL